MAVSIWKQIQPEDREVYVPVRNEAFEEYHGEGALEAVVLSRIFMGTNVRYIVRIPGEEFHVSLDATTVYREGDVIQLRMLEQRLWAVPYDDKL